MDRCHRVVYRRGTGTGCVNVGEEKTGHAVGYCVVVRSFISDEHIERREVVGCCVLQSPSAPVFHATTKKKKTRKTKKRENVFVYDTDRCDVGVRPKNALVSWRRYRRCSGRVGFPPPRELQLQPDSMHRTPFRIIGLVARLLLCGPRDRNC